MPPASRHFALEVRVEEHARADGLGQDERITRAGADIAPNLLWVDQTGDGQTQLGLFVFRGVPARDRCARFCDFFLQSGEHLTEHREVKLLRGKSHQAEGHDRPSTHGVDIRERVGCGDAAEHSGIVHRGRDEVGGRHNRAILGNTIDRRIVAGLEADQQRFVVRTRKLRENLGEPDRAQLSRSTTGL